MTIPVLLGADYHVLRDQDGDGNADPCPTGTHQAAYSTDTVACGGSFDVDGDGTAETLYCNIQSALDAATSPGDTVEIHAGTWVDGDTSPMTVDHLCNVSTHGQSFATVRSCSACTSESARRYVRGALVNGERDLPTLSFGASIEGALTLGVVDSDNIDYLTVSDLDIDSVHWNSCNNSYLGAINLVGDTDYLIVERVDFEPDAYNTVAENVGFTSETGVVFIANVGFNNGKDGDNVILRDNRSKATCWIGVKADTTCSSTPNVGQWNNWHIDHNEWWVLGGADVQCEMKGFTDFVISSNVFTTEGSNSGNRPSWKYRESGGKAWIFNNYVDELVKWYPQAPCFTEAYVFNNTGYSISWTAIAAHFPGAALRGVNNSCDECNQIYHDLDGDDTVGFDHHDGGVHYTGTPGSDLGGTITNAVTDSGNPPYGLAETDPRVDSGTNDPIGQGPDSCSITLWSGYTIDCTLDYEGDSRVGAGTSWDIGADEYVAFGAAVCGDGSQTGSEECDDGNTTAGDGCSPICRDETATILGISGTNWQINGVNTQIWGVRVANALHSDSAVSSLVAELDNWKAHGINMLSVTLQGGRTGDPPDDDDQENCYAADGTLSATCQGRLETLLDALDARSMTALVVMFYGRQDQNITGWTAGADDTTNLFNAIDETATWIRDQGYRNVAASVTNEHGHTSFDWDILASNTDGDRDTLCARWKSTSSRPCSNSRTSSAGYAYDFYEIHDTDPSDPGGSVPKLQSEMIRYDDYNEPGEFLQSEMDLTTTGITNAAANGFGWMFHAAWHQGVWEDGTIQGPRWTLGPQGTQPSTTDGDRSVHWAYDHIATTAGLDPHGGGGTCGDGTLDAGETCDDGNTVVDACVYGDAPPLTQVCNADCSALVDCASPQYCGDGAINGAESCDGSDLGGQTCIGLGFDGGTLACAGGCTYDTTGCVSASGQQGTLKSGDTTEGWK